MLGRVKMTDNFLEKTSLETLARKYAMKGEKIYIDGPVHYKGKCLLGYFLRSEEASKKADENMCYCC